MAESMVNSPNADKMGETAPINPALDVSVSFGRFENDSLSWEKWSSFSPNKYLEEVEKCATPGSVAQKKAYFEAHYKKIAARKAELLDQEKPTGSSPSRSNDPSGGDLIENNGRTGTELHESKNRSSFEVVKQEIKLDDQSSENHLEDGMITIECKGLSVEELEEEMNGRLDSPKSIKAEVVVEVEEKETPSVASRELKEPQCNLDKEGENTVKLKEENVKLHHSEESHKVTPASKDKNMARLKKKPVSPMPKTQFSSPRVSKPAPTSLTMSMSRSSRAPTSHTMSMSGSSTVKANRSSLPKSKNPSLGETKKAAPKSLHMSFSLDPPNSDPASLTTTRKSFIMEKMADKDIVKRAFKTFQNNYNQLKSSNELRSAIPKQVPTKATEQRVNTSVTPRKENGGSLKAGVVDKKNAKAAPSSFGSKQDERTEKRREFSKKLEEGSNARVAEKIRPLTKSKEMREADIKQPKHTLNSKTTSMPGVHRGQKVARNPSDKGVSKNEHHR